MNRILQLTWLSHNVLFFKSSMVIIPLVIILQTSLPKEFVILLILEVKPSIVFSKRNSKQHQIQYSMILLSWKTKWLEMFSSNFVYRWGQCGFTETDSWLDFPFLEWVFVSEWPITNLFEATQNPFRWINTVLIDKQNWKRTNRVIWLSMIKDSYCKWI